MIGHCLGHALAVTADFILLAALSVADNPRAAFAVATLAARAAAHSVAALLPAATTLAPAATFAFVATLSIAKGLLFAALGLVSATKSGSGLVQAERSQYRASNGTTNQAQQFSP